MIDTARLKTLARPGPRSRWVTKVILDVAVFMLAITAAYVVRLERFPSGPHLIHLLWLLPSLPLLRLTLGRVFGAHSTSWRLFGLPEAMLLLQSVVWGTVVLVVLRMLMPWVVPHYVVVPYGVVALEGLFTVTGVMAVRVVARMIDEHVERSELRLRGERPARRALLVGAGRAGRMATRELRNRPDAGYEPIGFVDDDVLRQGQVIEGVRVLGTSFGVAEIAERTRAEVLILTMPAASRAAIRAVVERCRATGLPVQTVPGLYELISGKVGITKIRPVRIEDLLGRDVVELDMQVASRVEHAFAGKRILVTGAGGSIGAELCRQLADQSPESLVLFEASENNLFDIDNEMRPKLGGVIPVLGDIRDPQQVERAFAEHRPQVVFHAAAYKHVPMMELHPPAAIDNNVLGTRIVAEAAARHGAERFLLVSTDKAVNPTSVMGASKRVAEMIVHANNGTSNTKFCAVRFGNVLGSRGSVLQTFQRQIEQGGPLTVTHPDITRFFMTIPEAVRLLIQACAIGDGGETFLLDMGEPVKIVEMARQMIRLAGLDDDDVPIEFVGLRPGEKLYEELLRRGESAVGCGVEGIMLAKGEEVEHVDLAPWVKRLERAGAEEDVTMIQRMLAVGTGYVTGFGADAEEGPPSASEGVGMVAKGKSSEITSVASAARLG